MGNVKSWFSSDQGVVVTAVSLTLLALLENSLLPWAPFYVVYALLALAMPLWLKTYRFGPLRAVRWWHWLVGMGTAVLIQIVGSLFLGLLVPSLFNGAGNPLYDNAAALQTMFAAAAGRLNMDAATVQTAYLLFIFVWAAFGEELFYRGYVQGVLSCRHAFWVAAIVSASFFGLRHATQLALLWPDYPWVAAAAWVLFSFAFGLVMSVLYQRTKSLILPVFIHLIVNALPLLALAPN